MISLKTLILSGCKGQPPKARYLSGLISTLSSIGTTLTLPYTYLTDRQPEPEPISLVFPESILGLSSLVSLDLNGFNLLDGALPDDLSYLSSLTILNLGNNSVTRLPYSISQLLNLKILLLDHCSKLQSLPYLPLSAQFVSAQGCTSLENYSNQVVVWTSGAARFTFINCHGLADDKGGIIADVTLQNMPLQSLWQRYMEVSLSLSLSLSLSHKCVRALSIFFTCLLIFYRAKFINLKAFAWLYLKLKFQSGLTIRSVGHLCESRYLLIYSIIEVGKGSLYVSFL